MKLSIFILTTTVLTASSLYAEPTKKYEVSKEAIKELELNLCVLSADKARDIIHATMQTKKFTAMPEVLSLTIAGSYERTIMQQLFNPDGLITSVIVHAANFGAGMLPGAEGIQTRRDIEEFTFLYVKNLCIAGSIKD